MGHERPRACPACHCLQNRSFNLQIAFGVQKTPHGRDHPRPLKQHCPRFRVAHEVLVPVPIALFDVCESVPVVAILFFAKRWRLQALIQRRQLSCVDCLLARFGNEQFALNADMSPMSSRL